MKHAKDRQLNVVIYMCMSTLMVDSDCIQICVYTNLPYRRLNPTFEINSPRYVSKTVVLGLHYFNYRL
jgi:hypothetical protein